jgi:sugar phosphate isomerase/epimerase
MKLCTSTGVLVEKFGLEEGLKVIADAGFDGVDFGFDIYLNWNQIRDEDKNSFLFDLEKCKEFAKELKHVLDKLGLKPYQCHAPFPSRRDDISEEFNQLIIESIKNCFYMCEIILIWVI